jgi:predicted transcriptional regulator
MGVRLTKPKPETRPVYLRMTPELVAWLDREAKRQRRSRAFIVSQAVRLMRAMYAELEERNAGC